MDIFSRRGASCLQGLVSGEWFVWFVIRMHVCMASHEGKGGAGGRK